MPGGWVCSGGGIQKRGSSPSFGDIQEMLEGHGEHKARVKAVGVQLAPSRMAHGDQQQDRGKGWGSAVCPWSGPSPKPSSPKVLGLDPLMVCRWSHWVRKGLGRSPRGNQAQSAEGVPKAQG